MENAITNPTSKRPYGKAKLKLITATLDSLMEGGFEGCSVRQICERADVSTGLINYHFGSMQGLVAAAYRHLALKMLSLAIERSEADFNDPRQQLTMFLKETFSERVMDERNLRACIVFWGMVYTSPLVKDVHEETNTAFWKYLDSIFTKLESSGTIRPSSRMASIGLTAIVDGLWLEWGLQSGSFSRKNALELCEQWIDAVWEPNIPITAKQ